MFRAFFLWFPVGEAVGGYVIQFFWKFDL